MKYANLTKKLEVVIQEDKIFDKKQLIKKFEDFINESGYRVEKWITSKCAPYEILIVDDNDIMIHLIIYLKNITGAGWGDKPNIKRVQVSNVRIKSPENYVSTTKYQSMVILGYYNFDDNPIMVAWDAYRYIKHKTMRSCYVNIDSLKIGYQNGYHITTNSSQKVWIFDAFHFDKFLKDYIEYNKN